MRLALRVAALLLMPVSPVLAQDFPPGCEIMHTFGTDYYRTPRGLHGHVGVSFIPFERDDDALSEGGLRLATILAERYNLVRRAAAGEMLRRCAPAGTLRLLLVGHASTGGTAQAGQELSLRRAQVLADALVEHGVPRDVISVRAAELRRATGSDLYDMVDINWRYDPN